MDFLCKKKNIVHFLFSDISLIVSREHGEIDTGRGDAGMKVIAG